MAIVKELKNLGKKMTGAELSGNTVSETLRAIEAKYSGGTAKKTETVAVLQLGTADSDGGDGMPEGALAWVVTDTAAATAIQAAIEEGETLYFDGIDYPLSPLGGPLLGFNVAMTPSEEGDSLPVFTGKPAYLVVCAEEGTDVIVEVLSSEDLSDSSVEILKMVDAEQGGDSQISEKVFDFTATVGENETLIVTPGEGVTWEAIKSALEETDNVFAHIGLPSDFMDASLHLRFSTIPHDGTGAGAAGLIQAASYVYAVGLNVIASGGETRCVGSLARLSTT